MSSKKTKQNYYYFRKDILHLYVYWVFLTGVLLDPDTSTN